LKDLIYIDWGKSNNGKKLTIRNFKNFTFHEK